MKNGFSQGLMMTVLGVAALAARAEIASVEDGRATLKVADATAAAGRVLYGSGLAVSNRDAWRAFDRFSADNSNGRWLPTVDAITNGNAWVTYVFDDPAPVLKYCRVMACGITATPAMNPARMVKSFRVEGSNDNAAWTTLIDRTSETSWWANETRDYTLPAVASYKYVRFTFRAVNDLQGSISAGAYGELAEIGYYTEPAESVDRYVSNAGTNGPGFSSWASAALILQDAINISFPGDRIWVADGYTVGAKLACWAQGNYARIAVPKAVSIASASGDWNHPATIAATPAGSYRALYLGEGASDSGLVIQDGVSTNGDTAAGYGGGVYAEATAVLSNCLIRNCRAVRGGGAAYGTLFGCRLANNTTTKHGAGAIKSKLVSCTVVSNTATQYGGGCALSTLTNCLVAFNTSGSVGGGVFESTLDDCRVLTNTAGTFGGGIGAGWGWDVNAASAYIARNCLIDGNKAVTGGGLFNGILQNCIVTHNRGDLYGSGAAWLQAYNCAIEANTNTDTTAASTAVAYGRLYNCTVARNSNSGVGIGNNGAIPNCYSFLTNSISWGNRYADVSGQGYYGYSCSASATSGTGNLMSDPRLQLTAAGVSALALDSPCCGRALAFAWMSDAADARSRDILGNPRLDGRGPDMGAVEVISLKPTVYTFR